MLKNGDLVTNLREAARGTGNLMSLSVSVMRLGKALHNRGPASEGKNGDGKESSSALARGSSSVGTSFQLK
eukprot:2035163-Rhodomonas_salina.5